MPANRNQATPQGQLEVAAPLHHSATPGMKPRRLRAGEPSEKIWNSNLSALTNAHGIGPTAYAAIDTAPATARRAVDQPQLPGASGAGRASKERPVAAVWEAHVGDAD
jgi:hypothetical protein